MRDGLCRKIYKIGTGKIRFLQEGIEMSNYGLPTYDKYRKWIQMARDRGTEWDKIMYAMKNDENGLIIFLEEQKNTNWWEINSQEWKEIVQLQKNAEEQTKDIDYVEGQAMIMDEGQDNAVTIPEGNQSAWQLYKKSLLNQGFKEFVVNDIEKTTLKILKRLSGDTTEMLPVKGLVIGNVQSGKTANMAALMAMAADWGWNMFIVLSGTIDNLRQQTQNRLLNDLNCPGNLNWSGLEHLSKKPVLGQRAQDLHFEEDSKQRYFTVCLKNSGRLKKLIQWLQVDANKQKQMKILVIDDEADQAGINTADISTNERRAISKLICNMVNGKNEKSQEVDIKYRAMNYIGYTATPYANVLNEAGEDSLYPRNFITTLGVSKEYFGPQQIFGVDGGDYDGMSIVRIIEESDLNAIKEIHDEGSPYVPVGLQDAVCWFLCGAACMRIWNYKKPISMLIHTSQKTDHHKNIAEAVKDWISSKTPEFICEKCENVWNTEIELFSFEKFREQYFDYDRSDEEINQYPDFEKVKEELLKLLSHNVTNIPLDSEQELVYHKGIHLCVDNCKNNGVTEDGMFVRLAYPDSKKMPSPAPVFIIIGGATLSRGLTIEGLISTFFLRSVNQADTLMQMGRWFGYRKNYELLPRIWITSKTNDQFKFLSDLDEELREEIYNMDIMGKTPAQYGPKIKNTPMYSFIRITAKNRMQSANSTDMDYSGSFNQTYLFDNNQQQLKSNIETVEKFVEKLGMPEKQKSCNRHADNHMIWRNINYTLVKEMLKEYKFADRLEVFRDIDAIFDWIQKNTNEGKLDAWNIVIAGKGSDSNSVWKLPYGSINKVSRTRKSDSKYESIINIGVLRDPKDIVSDIDLEGKDKNLLDKMKSFKSKEAKMIRNLAGLDTTPQLIIYMIDKGSVYTGNGARKDLNATEDIVGICMNIPGGKKGTNYAAAVSIHLKNDIFNGEGDLEDTYEN